MREYNTEEAKKTIVIKAQTRLIKVSCDLCGAVAHSIDDWSTRGYGIDEITISQKDGDSYPEGGSGTEYNVDMCPKCFKEKLIPWLESQGCKAKRKSWDW